MDGPWFINGSWYETHFCCIQGFEYNWQLCVIDPTSSPVNFGLYCSEPWVAQDCFVFSQLCEEEPHISTRRSRSYSEVGVELELSCFVLRTINVK